jgi:hypothetical protein
MRMNIGKIFFFRQRKTEEHKAIKTVEKGKEWNEKKKLLR